MTLADLERAVDWARLEGWNPGLADAPAFHAADPQGFFGGWLEGEMVSSVSAVKYGSGFGFVGFYIVRPEFRGQGHGMATWRHAMDYLAGRNVALDGVLEQEDNYAKSGFVKACSNIRFAGQGGGALPDGLVPLESVPLEDILSYDARCFPAGREVFMRAWLGMPNARGFAELDGSRLSGFGLIRRCHSGFKIGPLYAESADSAQRLYSALAAQAEGETLYLDVPETHSEAMALASGRGMSEVFRTVRMYTSGEPQVEQRLIYGVTSFELG